MFLIFEAMKYRKTTLFLCLFLPIQIVFIRYLSGQTEWIETHYSQSFYPFLSETLRYLLGWIPFSVGDVIGFVLAFYFLKSTVQLIRTKFTNFIPISLKFISYLSVVHFLFYTFWGLNYFRAPMAKRLKLQQEAYSDQALLQTTERIIYELNSRHFQLTASDTAVVKVPYSRATIYKMAPEGFAVLANTYPQLEYHHRSIKSSLVSLFHSYGGTAGYFNPITGEAQVNYQIPLNGYAATTCHEMAHQLGWAAENDANFLGFLATIHHKDLYFQYAGYRMAYRYCIDEMYKRMPEEAAHLRSTLRMGIRKDYYQTHLHWNSFKNPIEPLLKKGYSSYLKANNQTHGIESYDYVVDLLIAYYKTKTNSND